MSRVVVTGIGVMAPGSLEKESYWANISEGKVFTGPALLNSFKDLRVKVSGEIKNFNENEYLKDKNDVIFAKIDRAEKFALKTIDMALKDSNVDLSSLRNGEISVSLGTTMGKVSKQIDHRLNYEPYEKLIELDNNQKTDILKEMSPGGILATVCKYFDFKNAQARMFLNACAAGNYSIGWGYDKIKNGDAKLAIVGGVDSFSLTALVGFNRLLSLTNDVCRPFDKNRKGLIVSEGCGILVLEDLNSAKKRNAHIYGEIRGYGLSIDAYHITAPRPDASGAISCMQKALKNSQISPDEIDYVSAHGTGTKLNDKIESKAICSVFEDKIPPVSSIKSMIGHSLGASAALEAVASLLMIQDETAVPIANFEEPDEECPIDCIPNKSRKMKIDNIISNSFAFGGNNSSLIISRYREAGN